MVKRSRSVQRGVAGVVDRGASSVKMLQRWRRRRPPPRVPLLPSLLFWCGGSGGKGQGLLGFGGAARVLGGSLGVLKGWLKGCGAGPDV
jgi:hypothetical protein